MDSNCIAFIYVYMYIRDQKVDCLRRVFRGRGEGNWFGIWRPRGPNFRRPASIGKLLQASGVCAHHGVWRLEPPFSWRPASTYWSLKASGVQQSNLMYLASVGLICICRRPGVSCYRFLRPGVWGYPYPPPPHKGCRPYSCCHEKLQIDVSGGWLGSAFWRFSVPIMNIF